MKLKRIAASVGLALTLGGAALSANATTYDLGTVFAGTTAADALLPASGSFSDTFDFTLGFGSGTKVSITSFFYGTTAGDAPTFTLTGIGSPVVASQSFGDPDLSTVGYSHQFSGLTLGTLYHLTVNGTDSSNLGQNYTFQIAAVPEPETFAMLLAGLGLMGAVARRRKALSAKNTADFGA